MTKYQMNRLIEKMKIESDIKFDTPEKFKAFLYSTGFYDKDGKLKEEPYKE